MLEFDRHRAPEHERSICDECESYDRPWDQDAFQIYSHKFESIHFGKNKTLRTETARKYAVRVVDHTSPCSWGFGVHELSKCAFPYENPAGGVRWAVAIQDVYLRHYKCLNERQPKCDPGVRHDISWPVNFGSDWE